MLVNLKNEMKRKNVTIKELARRLGLSQNSISWKIREHREFTLSELAEISKILDCTIDYLVAVRNEDSRPPDKPR